MKTLKINNSMAEIQVMPAFTCKKVLKKCEKCPYILIEKTGLKSKSNNLFKNKNG